MHEPSVLIEHPLVFVLASVLGLELIRGVSRLLHTPLMSLTNAIASIAIVGSLLITGRPHDSVLITVLGTVAIACSSINAVGGFLITERLLKMFKKRGECAHARDVRLFISCAVRVPRLRRPVHPLAEVDGPGKDRAPRQLGGHRRH